MRKRELERLRRKFKQPEEYYMQAQHYFDNAKETLKEVYIEHNRYKDEKRVRRACAEAYLAVLFALDGYFIARGVAEDKLPASTSAYWTFLDKYLAHNGKIYDAFSTTYENLHIFGYYRGGVNTDMIKAGFKSAKFIIDTLSK